MTTLSCSANQWTGFYIITASVMKELRLPPLENDNFKKVSSEAHVNDFLIRRKVMSCSQDIQAFVF